MLFKNQWNRVKDVVGSILTKINNILEERRIKKEAKKEAKHQQRADSVMKAA